MSWGENKYTRPIREDIDTGLWLSLSKANQSSRQRLSEMAMRWVWAATNALTNAGSDSNYLVVLYPERAVSEGDDILEPFDDVMESRFIGDNFPRGADVDLDVEQVVEGRTVFNGRNGIVTKISGEIVVRYRGQKSRISIGGYEIIDSATGLRLQTRIAYDGEIAGNSAHIDSNVDSSMN